MLEFSERRLITMFQNGDQSALEVLMNKYKDNLVRMASRILQGNADSDDVVQETFIRFYLSINRFDESKSLSAWLYRIGKNVCLDILRKRKGTLPLDGASHDEALQRRETIASEEKTPEEAAITKENGQMVAAILDSLPDKYKPLFVSQYMHGMSLEEISQAEQLPLNTVKSRMNRGRSLLRRKWGKALVYYFMVLTLYIQLIG
ncbi:MAG: sigma-70 family RNA polymerase sigma factor [Paenibacillaceae bacterium]|nr:sigma-70 family RNA polymerase sigma factor [Paenibacillaceae bacterium]